MEGILYPQTNLERRPAILPAIPELQHSPSRHALQSLAQRLAGFSTISLAEIERATLQTREDTKFVLGESTLLNLLNRLEDSYAILYHCGSRIQPYHTLYFDTPDLQMYHAHHRGAAVRYKVRSREYVLSGLTMFEVKQKTIKGRTVKHRMQTPYLLTDRRALPYDFIGKAYPDVPDGLQPALWNRFWRVTLVNLVAPERVTLDFSLSYLQDGLVFPVPGIVIAEIKQRQRTRNTPFWRHLHDLSIGPSPISKYCLGVTVTRPWIKQNNFKPLHRKLQRLTQGDFYERVH